MCTGGRLPRRGTIVPYRHYTDALMMTAPSCAREHVYPHGHKGGIPMNSRYLRFGAHCIQVPVVDRTIHAME